MKSITLARAWTEALNERDAERLLELSAPEIELIGPKGRGRGFPLLLEWLTRAGATFRAIRVFARDDAVVLDQIGTWTRPDKARTDNSYRVASAFRCSNGRVQFYARHDGLVEALSAAGLSLADEVREPANPVLQSFEMKDPASIEQRNSGGRSDPPHDR